MCNECWHQNADGCNLIATRHKTSATDLLSEVDTPTTEDNVQVPNRRDCEELCLSEAAFPCRSADYNILTLACALSRETRRTQTSAYANSRDHEYLENSCINTEELSCPYKRTDNAYPRYLDTIATRVNDDIDCEKQCTFFQDFVCRSFAFYASASQCFISGTLRKLITVFCLFQNLQRKSQSM